MGKEFSLSLDQIVAAYGCSEKEAFGELMTLHDQRLVEGYLLVYHGDHFSSRHDILTGFPWFPFIYLGCGEEIANSEGLSYDFLFEGGDDALINL